MNDAFDPTRAAGLLADCWRQGCLIDELPMPYRPATLDEGYDVQDQLIAALGQPAAGWKLGVGSVLQKRQSGIGRSIAGRILRSALHRDGDEVTWSGSGAVTIEFEIAYILNRDVLPDAQPVPPAELIGETRVAIELVRSRFVDRRAVGWPSFAADDAACHALILGEPLDAQALATLSGSLMVSLDGAERARSLTGDDRTDPLEALADLVAIARERRMTLPAGSIVSTGTLSKPFDVAAPGGTLEARYDGGRLGLRLSASREPRPGTARRPE